MSRKPPIIIRVGTPEGTAYVFAPIDVGNGAGIFAKAGLEVEKLNFGGGAKLEQAMSAGAIDMSVAGNIGLAYATKGVPEKAVAVVAGAAGRDVDHHPLGRRHQKGRGPQGQNHRRRRRDLADRLAGAAACRNTRAGAPTA